MILKYAYTSFPLALPLSDFFGFLSYYTFFPQAPLREIIQDAESDQVKALGAFA